LLCIRVGRTLWGSVGPGDGDGYDVGALVIRWLLAVVHLLALGIGLGAIWVRAGALRELGRRGGGSLRTVFTADTWWMVALTLWLVTGLIRAIAGLEKPGAYYLHNQLFWVKMTLAAAVYIIELWPMAILIQWGIWVGKGRPVDTRLAPRLATMSYVQAALLVGIVLTAAAMARGFGVPV
jgi:putative membrane protein